MPKGLTLVQKGIANFIDNITRPCSFIPQQAYWWWPLSRSAPLGHHITINMLRPKQRVWHCADIILKCILLTFSRTYIDLKLFLRDQLTISQHWSTLWHVSNRRRDITQTNDDLVQWRICAPLGLSKLNWPDVAITRYTALVGGELVTWSVVKLRQISSAIWKMSSGHRKRIRYLYSNIQRNLEV